MSITDITITNVSISRNGASVRNIKFEIIKEIFGLNWIEQAVRGYQHFNNLLIIFTQTRKRYRNRAEIYASLLQGAAAEKTKGITITRLMYASMLSYRQMSVHLQVLLKERLLEYDDLKVYKVTSRGLQFLELYTKMAEMLEPITGWRNHEVTKGMRRKAIVMEDQKHLGILQALEKNTS